MRDPGVFPPTVAPTGYRSAWLLSWPWIFPQGPAYRYRLARHPIDADRGRRERPPLRFGAPSALPPWRVHFPEPVPGPSVRSLVPRAVDQSPGGDSRGRRLSVGLGPGHCPTTDESVAVMVGASIRERPRLRERSARCGPSDDRGRTPGLTGAAGHRVSALPPGPRSRGGGPARPAPASTRGWTSTWTPGSLRRPAASGWAGAVGWLGRGAPRRVRPFRTAVEPLPRPDRG